MIITKRIYNLKIEIWNNIKQVDIENMSVTDSVILSFEEAKELIEFLEENMID